MPCAVLEFGRVRMRFGNRQPGAVEELCAVVQCRLFTNRTPFQRLIYCRTKLMQVSPWNLGEALGHLLVIPDPLTRFIENNPRSMDDTVVRSLEGAFGRTGREMGIGSFQRTTGARQDLVTSRLHDDTIVTPTSPDC